MRIVMAANRCFPEMGGLESHIEHLAPLLVERRFDVRLVVADRSGLLPSNDRQGSVSVRRFRAWPRTRDYYLSPGLFFELLRGRYDLLHVQGINALVPPTAMLAAFLRRRPFVVTFHSGGATTALRRRLRGLQFRLQGPLLKRAAGLVAVSEFEREYFSKLLRLPPARMHVVRNGGVRVVKPIDVEVDRDLVLSVGRLERYKGHHRAIEALPELLKVRPHARLRILGSGPYGGELRRSALALGVADKVEFDFVDPADRGRMAEEMARAGVVILLSDYEAHPVAVMEALALGRPVVVLKTSGLLELVEAGWVRGIASDADASCIAAAIAAETGGAARVEPSLLPTWEECADSVSSIYLAVGETLR